MLSYKKIFIPLLALMLLPACWPFKKTDENKKTTENKAPYQSAVKEITTQADYNDIIKSDLVIAKFHASWCPPCKAMKPIFADVSNRYSDKATFISINIDTKDLQETIRTYADQGVPTFVYFKDGKVIEKRPGAYSPSGFENAVKDFITANK